MLESGVKLYASGKVGALVNSSDQPSSKLESSGTCSTTTVDIPRLEIVVWKVAFMEDIAGDENNAGVTICTDAAEYWLHSPSEDYSPFFVALKVFILILSFAAIC